MAALNSTENEVYSGAPESAAAAAATYCDGQQTHGSELDYICTLVK